MNPHEPGPHINTVSLEIPDRQPTGQIPFALCVILGGAMLYAALSYPMQDLHQNILLVVGGALLPFGVLYIQASKIRKLKEDAKNLPKFRLEDQK